MPKRSFSQIVVYVTLIVFSAGCSHKICDYEATRLANMEQELEYLYSDPLCEPSLTLEDIIEISLARNLDLIVKNQELAIQEEISTGAKLKMLPAIRGNSEWYTRNRNTAAFSESLVPGVPPAPLSISQDAHWNRQDGSFIFNLLDFGLSYYRAQQESNRIVMLEMEYERAQQNLILDVTKAYWRAIAAKRAVIKSQAIIEKANTQLGNLSSQMEAKVISEIQGLRNQNQLLTINLQLQSYDKDYHSAMTELALYMGLPPCCHFEILEPTSICTDIEVCDICELEKTALLNRPELTGKDAEELIWADEARVAIAQMFPGVEFWAGSFRDTNHFLLFQNWLAAGIRATYNLLALPQFWKQKDIANEKVDLAYLNRLALSMGVMTQVHLAYLVYLDNRKQFLLAYDLQQVNEKLLAAANKEQKQGKLHLADILRYEAESLISEINAAKAYGDMQNSIEQLNNAIGIPRYFKTEGCICSTFAPSRKTSFKSSPLRIAAPKNTAATKEEDEEPFMETPISIVNPRYEGTMIIEEPYNSSARSREIPYFVETEIYEEPISIPSTGR